MQIKRRAITIGTTFFLAAATGHVMQTTSSEPQHDAAMTFPKQLPAEIVVASSTELKPQIAGVAELKLTSQVEVISDP